MYKKYSTLLSVFTIAVLFSSCFSSKPTKYFYEVSETTITPDLHAGDYTLQANDIISVFFSSLNEEATKVFNMPNSQVISSATASGGSTPATGYLINKEGTIQLPILGVIKASGLTTQQLKDQITKLVVDKKLLTDPVVTVRHLNYEVTVLGEVGRPTVITVNNEQMNIMKALGLAGDITIFGDKENVLLIRERDGKRQVHRINLNDSKFLQSPYYFLQPNDVIYVEPTKNKVASASRSVQLIPTILSTLSFLVVVVTQFINK